MSVSPSTASAETGFARRPLLTFFALAFAFTWALLPLARSSIAVSLLALCGPAVAAVVTAALAGREVRRALWHRTAVWRLPLRWYLLALLLPFPISLLASGIGLLLGAQGEIAPIPINPLSLVVFLLVIGEEIGWRGFALPHLLERFGPWTASAILGTVWALWHLPLFYMVGMPQHGAPFPPYIAYTVSLSLLLTWLAMHTAGSVIIATLFHGAVNTFIVTNEAADATTKGWSNALAFGCAALVICGLAWRRRSHA